jgi:hypothetical protein
MISEKGRLLADDLDGDAGFPQEEDAAGDESRNPDEPGTDRYQLECAVDNAP